MSGGGELKMKKAVTREPKKLNTGVPKGGKRKFTGVIDELSYTLAKLRGEILDDTPVKDIDNASVDR